MVATSRMQGGDPLFVEDIERLGAVGAAIVDPGRIALNPDCGFAPDYGEPPSIDEAYEKLCRLTEAAGRLQSHFLESILF